MSATSAFSLFFFNDTATTEIYTLSLHDALPISLFAALNTLDGTVIGMCQERHRHQEWLKFLRVIDDVTPAGDRKSTRLNSSHTVISYAVFCLKKKKSDHTATLCER